MDGGLKDPDHRSFHAGAGRMTLCDELRKLDDGVLIGAATTALKWVGAPYNGGR